MDYLLYMHHRKPSTPKFNFAACLTDYQHVILGLARVQLLTVDYTPHNELMVLRCLFKLANQYRISHVNVDIDKLVIVQVCFVCFFSF